MTADTMNAAQMQSLDEQAWQNAKVKAAAYDAEMERKAAWIPGGCASLGDGRYQIVDRAVPTIDRVVGRTRQEIEQRIATLQEEDILLRNYLVAKFRANDLHGVEDAASDLRDLEAAMGALRWVLGE